MVSIVIYRGKRAKQEIKDERKGARKSGSVGRREGAKHKGSHFCSRVR